MKQFLSTNVMSSILVFVLILFGNVHSEHSFRSFCFSKSCIFRGLRTRQREQDRVLVYMKANFKSKVWIIVRF